MRLKIQEAAHVDMLNSVRATTAKRTLVDDQEYHHMLLNTAISQQILELELTQSTIDREVIRFMFAHHSVTCDFEPIKHIGARKHNL